VLRPKGTAAAILARIVQRRLKRKCRLALDSIAERYSERRTHPFHSDKVLAEQGYPTLRSSHAERTRMATRPELSIQRPQLALKGDLK
jgi:hypothetical protein